MTTVMNEYGPEATDEDSVTTASVHFVVDAPTGTGKIVCTTVAVTGSETVISVMDAETPTAPVWASVISGCVTYTVTVTMLGDKPVLVTVLPTTEVYNSDDGVTVVVLVIVT